MVRIQQFIIILLLTSCTTPSLISPRPTGDDPILSDTQFTEYTFMPGRHQSYKDGTSTLNIFSQTLYNYKKLNNISYTVVFDSSAVYDWKGDPDQLDWNKGGGFALDWKRNDRDNLMWAWRYNPDAGEFELTTYINWKYKRRIGHYDSRVLLRARPDELISIQFNRTDNKWWEVVYQNVMTGELFSHQVEVRIAPKLARRIYPWFGGANNARPPMDQIDYGGVPNKKMKIFMHYSSN
jgi:hypothetical protein